MKILIKNISQIVSAGTREGYMPLMGSETRSPIIPGNSILIENNKIKQIGVNVKEENIDKIIDAKNKLVTPGFCDNHTHLVFGGTRENEFEKRIKGIPYKQIAKEGGGILSSVRMTRKTSFEELYENSEFWLKKIISTGITSIEIKSGYGLDVETELKQLRVIKKLKENFSINIKATFLGAHEIPEEYRNNRREYIRIIKEEMLPRISEEELADYIDVFCEKGVYTPEETEEILTEGEMYGLKPRIHADEIDESGGSTVAAKMQLLSVDHMNVPNEKDLPELSDNKTIITLLPATNFILSINKNPPIDLLRKYKNIIAISTDFNPGSSPMYSIVLSATIGMIKYKLLPDELIYAITTNPAYSLELSKTTGSIVEGKDADILIHDIDNYKQLFYFMGNNSVRMVIAKGEIIYERND